MRDLFPIRFEIRMSRLHVGFSGPHSWFILPFLAVICRFGLSYVPNTLDWNEHRSKLDWTPITLLPKRLNKFLLAAKFTHSLELRASNMEDLDFSKIERLRRLRYLSFQSNIGHEIDLSLLKNLKVLAARSNQSKKFTGLSNLDKLETVLAPKADGEWVASLPSSVNYLNTSGRMKTKSSLGNLSNLTKWTISNCRLLDLKDYNWSLRSVKTLELLGVKEIRNPQIIRELFPNVELINVVGLQPESESAFLDACRGFTNVDVYESYEKLYGY
jgi:hypothetical protein